MASMSEAEIRRYLARIGSKGGKAGIGESKLRGSPEYYKRISKLAVAARKARHGNAPKTNTPKRRTK
jgi:hypothetical protein